MTAVAGLIAAAAPATGAPRAIAIAPLDAATLGTDAKQLSKVLQRRFRAMTHVRAVFLTQQDECHDAADGAIERCWRDAAVKRGAASVVLLSAARLGDTLVLRLKRLDALGTAASGSWQRVLYRSDAPAVRAAIDSLLTRAIPRPTRSPRWYQRWWLWAGAATATAAVISVAAVVSRGEDEPGWLVRPP